MKNLVIVLLGGMSGERKISFLTGKACSNALKNKGYKVMVLLISGRPMNIAEHIDDWDGFAAIWLPGSEGDGVSDINIKKSIEFHLKLTTAIRGMTPIWMMRIHRWTKIVYSKLWIALDFPFSI